MKLWLLRPVVGHGNLEDDPWSPWYDKAVGFVIRADTEENARVLAQSRGGDEVRLHISSLADYVGQKPEPMTVLFPAWTSKRFSTCTELLVDGQEEVIIRDFNAA